MKKIGVLALQGDFEAHGKAVERAGAQAVEVRTAADLESIDGLIIPGGESTAMLFELHWVDCYHAPDKGSGRQLMQLLTAAVERDISCLQFHATPHRQRCGIGGECHKREPWCQTHIRHAWGIFLAPQHLQMVQLCPGEPGSELGTRDNDGVDLCLAQARLVVIGV